MIQPCGERLGWHTLPHRLSKYLINQLTDEFALLCSRELLQLRDGIADHCCQHTKLRFASQALLPWRLLRGPLRGRLPDRRSKGGATLRRRRLIVQPRVAELARLPWVFQRVAINPAKGCTPCAQGCASDPARGQMEQTEEFLENPRDTHLPIPKGLNRCGGAGLMPR